jgi:hypothetical protein
MEPGTVFVYSGTVEGHPQSDTVRILNQTKNIANVTTLVINDTVFVDGAKEETTLGYFAQDNVGNVWYFGEDVNLIRDGQVVGHNGSWAAGVNGALPGYIMEAHPNPGDFYCNENAPGIAQDQAQVLSVSASVCFPKLCTNASALLVNDTSSLKPGSVEHKWYVAGVGNVMAEDVAGGQDQVQLVTFSQNERNLQKTVTSTATFMQTLTTTETIESTTTVVYQVSIAMLLILLLLELAFAILKRR